MSRFLVWTAATRRTIGELLGAARTEQFAGLAQLHRDGWGLARRVEGGRLAVELSPSRLTRQDAERVLGTAAASGGLVYLRFASAGSLASPENSQPFERDGFVFAHNGALSPIGPLDALLDDEGRETLRGTTDSERYFALARRRVAEHGGPESVEATRRGLIAAVRELRDLYPDASLNAVLMTRRTTLVVHSGAARPAPLSVFAARGTPVDALPPGHDDTYNVLHCAKMGDGWVIATTGLDPEGWSRLPEDTVTVLDAATAVSHPIDPPPSADREGVHGVR